MGYLIKRVIGMSGDRVVCCTMKRAVTVNGEALDESWYLYSEDEVRVAPPTMLFDVIAPVDRILALGGHRDASVDSHYHLRDTRDGRKAGSAASVPKNKVVETAVAVVVPLDRLSAFRVPETFAEVPEPEQEALTGPTIIETSVGCWATPTRTRTS